MLLTFEFKTVEEAKEFLEGLTGKREPVAPANPLAVNGPGIPHVSKPSSEFDVTNIPVDVVKEFKKLKRKKSKQAPVTYTIENVREALQQVFETKGRGALVDVLKSVGAESVSAINPDQYSQVIKIAAKALAK